MSDILYMSKNEVGSAHYRRNRYDATTRGCGCCEGYASPVGIKDCKEYIAQLEEQLELARAALADMEANGELFPIMEEVDDAAYR